MVDGMRKSMGLRLWRKCAAASCLAVTMAASTAASAQEACPLSATDKANLFKNPFKAASAHHRPIGTDAIYATDTDPGTVDWLETTHLNLNIGNPSGTHVVEVSNRDPFYVIGGAANCDNVTGMPVTIRMPAGGILTTVARPDGGCADNVVIVFDKGAANNTTDDQVHQLRQFDWNNGSPVAQKRGTWDIRGLGHGTKYGERVGSAASGVAGLFGVLRGHEINTPGYKITHALHLGLPRKEGPGCKVMLSREVVLPATFRDRNYNDANNNTGNIPYGALMALRQDVDITTLGLSEVGLRLAEGLREYGAYVVNGGGCNAGAIDADQHVSYATRRTLRSDIRKIYPLMRRVMNNDVLGSPVAGGGTPLGPNCAFDAT